MVVKITNQCINNDGFLVTVHEEKKTKRIPWPRGESYLRPKMRVPDSSTSTAMVSFSRRPGKKSKKQLPSGFGHVIILSTVEEIYIMFATKAEVTSFVEAVVAKTIKVAEQQKMVEPGFKVKITISTSLARKRSWGGFRYRTGPFINLAVAQYMGSQNATNNLFREYRSFASSPVIGSVRGAAEKTLATLVVHEVAHAIQYGVRAGSFHDSVIDGTGTRGHGVLWKSIYAALRSAIINGDAFDESQYKKVVVENTKRVVKAVKTARVPRTPVSTMLKEQMFDEYKRLLKMDWSTYKASRMIADKFGLNQNTAVYYCYKFKKIL